jgi:hypothetical protein
MVNIHPASSGEPQCTAMHTLNVGVGAMYPEVGTFYG